MIPDSITIFTDGSSRGNPGPGGFGAVIILPSQNNENQESRIKNYEVKEIGGKEEWTTNNRMELQAAISALSFVSNVKGQLSIVIYSDSSYLINGITKWVFGWQKNHWMTATKKPVENRDLWEKLIEVARGKQIEWRQVGGHVGVAGNERCDDIAQTYAELTPTDAEKKLKLYNGPLENYPIKDILNLYDISYKKQEAKNAFRAHQKAKAYSYVSQVDGKTMTHKTWAECEARVKGQPAKYKKAVSPENEKEIINEFSFPNKKE